VLAVAPLQVPDGTVLNRPGDLPRLDAVTLFADRAASVAPGFSLTDDNVSQVAEICARLDGLPLAIELAASRAALLSPGAMLQLMERPLPLLVRGPRDVPARQRTLRGAIDWSYELLTDGERMTFRRLSTLAGGSTLEAATAVCDPDGREGIDVLEGLATLVDSSLIRAATGSDDVRYDMLRTVREFGAERLEADDDRAAIERRHACWFLRLAEEAEPHFRGPELERWLRTLEVEHDNLRAAIRWALEEDDAEIGLRLAGSMWRLWHLGGYISEGRHWVSAVLSLPSASEGTRPKAKALAALGGLAYWQNDVPAVRDAYEQALAISRELHDEAGIAEGSYNLGFAFGLEQDRAGALALFLQSLAMFERLDDPRGVADSMWALSLITRLEGDLTAALGYAEGSARRHRDLGDLFGIVDSLHELGRASLAMGDLDTARSCFLEVLETVAPFGYRTGMSIALDDLAAQEIGRGEIVRALRLRGASEALKESSGGRAPAEYVDQPDPRATARSSMGEQQMAAEWDEGAAMTVPEIVAYARGEQ
jgi:predicted ATPase